jgi:hypothetical protein
MEALWEWARIRSRHAATVPAKRSSVRSASEVTCSGAWTITSWAPLAGWEAKRSGSPALVDARSGSTALARPDSAPAPRPESAPSPSAASTG